MKTLFKLSLFCLSSAFLLTGVSATVFAQGETNNGVIIDGLSMVLDQNGKDGTSPAIFAQNPPGQTAGSWMLDCTNAKKTAGSVTGCESTWAKTFNQTSYGKTVKYVLLDFPSINFALMPASGVKILPAATQTCPAITQSTLKSTFKPQVFNYVVPYVAYSPNAGDYLNSCVGGQAITSAYKVNGMVPIPMISGSGPALAALSSALLAELATQIGQAIVNDPNVGGVAFDLEKKLSGSVANKAFFGTLSEYLAKNKPSDYIFVYDGDWGNLSRYPNVIAMRAVYGSGIAGTAHWGEALSPAGYQTQVDQFVSDGVPINKMMAVLPAAASDTVWQALNVEHDKATTGPVNPYAAGLPLPTEPMLAPVDQTSCVSGNKLNCKGYTNEVPGGQAGYIDEAIKTINKSKSNMGNFFGYMLYNIKPSNFWTYGCSKNLKKECLNHMPENIPDAVLNLNFNSAT